MEKDDNYLASPMLPSLYSQDYTDLNHHDHVLQEHGEQDFLNFGVILNDIMDNKEHDQYQPIMVPQRDEKETAAPIRNHNHSSDQKLHDQFLQKDHEDDDHVQEKAHRIFLSREEEEEEEGNKKKKRKKSERSVKTSEQVEIQRMIHIAVERNRRKQMNEHLRILKSLMPSSYVQRGDQASIIGGAIEFVRELEQLLQCLESQKRRKLSNSSHENLQHPHDPRLIFPPNLPLPNEHDEIKIMGFETGLIREETAEKRSCLADVEVKLLGFDGMIKILSMRRPGQLVQTITALEDLQLNILHTNITTIEQTVLYSFNVKVGSELRFTAEEIASSVQEIFSLIHANSNILM